MFMNRTGKNPGYQSKFQNDTIECVSSYTYLGIELANNGSFSLAQKKLNEKAMRALFKLRSMISGTDLDAHTSLKLFDQVVKPVALYGSEIWGVNCLNYKNRESLMNSMNKIKC